MASTPFQETDVVVIGAGAAGLMCAAIAGQRGRSVVLIEHNERIGKKILISGGGRCNFTNLGATPENYLSERPDFCKSALARYTPFHFLEWVDKYGIAYHEKKLGQQFCDGSSKEIVGLLERECEEGNVATELNCRVEQIARDDQGSFEITTTRGNWRAGALVIATGSLSFPNLGATDFGHRIARQFGLPLVECRPGLVPLTWNERAYFDISGVSVLVHVAHRGGSFEENLLFTHRGLSGPAILQISSYWQTGESLAFDLLPGVDAADWLQTHQSERIELTTLLSQRLPRRFIQLWTQQSDLHRPGQPLSNYKTQSLAAIGQQLNHWRIRPTGTEGYAKAEVTLGGVSTEALSSKTFEARTVPGLYFIGEVVDVTGWLGGYNFQWAWASGHAAGSAL